MLFLGIMLFTDFNAEDLTVSIRLLCDSTFDLPVEEIKKYQIDVLPLYIQLGETTYRDNKKDITVEQLFDFVEKNNTLPKTAALTINDYMEIFKKILDEGDDIISTGISSKLSVTFNNSILAREELAAMGYDPARIRLIDSEHLSTGIAHLLIYIRKLIDQGKSLDEIEMLANAYKKRISTSFILDTLEYMHMGGRCSSMVYHAANVLGLHPKLSMEEGKLVPGEKYRGNYTRKCLRNYFENTVQVNIDNIEKELIFITTTSVGPLSDAAKELLEGLGFENVMVTQAGATIASHCGPNCIGFLFVTKE